MLAVASDDPKVFVEGLRALLGSRSMGIEASEVIAQDLLKRELARTNKRIRRIGPVIERQIAGLYRQQPYAIDELRAILTSTLSDTTSVKRILRSVEQRMREKPASVVEPSK